MRKFLLYIGILISLPGITNAQQRTCTLQSCLAEGLEHNYSIRISRNEEQVSKNNATLANAGFLPTLDFSAGYRGTLDDTETTARATGEKNKNNNVFDQTINAGLSLNWTIFDGFKITTNHQRLKELERMGETNTRIAIEDLIANLTAEYYNYVQQKIRLNNLRYAVSLSKERLRIVEARYNIGSFSRLDLQQARVDFNADSSKYMKQQEQLYTSRIVLNELMANPNVDEDIFIPDTIIDVNMLLNLTEIWENTMTINASLIKAEQNNMLAQLDYKTVISRNYPYLKLNSGYGYTLNKYDIAANKQRTNWGFNAGVTVGINLFDGNRSRERKNARIAIENSRLQRERLELGLQADITNLWQAYQNNMEVLKLERENLIAAKENHLIAMDRYMLGDLSGFEMREVQKSLLDAEERILTAAYNTKLCEISLMQISGKVAEYLD